jgi:DNA-damage-inducible protein D
METNLALFRGSGISKTLHNNGWWFVIDDVVGVLMDSADPSGYIKDMCRHDRELSKGWGQIATPLWIETEGGKQQIDCANTEGCLTGKLPDRTGEQETTETVEGVIVLI